MKRISVGGLLLAAAGLSGFPSLGAPPTFFDRRDYPIGETWQAVADVNGDKIPDLVTLNGCCILVLFGNGDGTFRNGPSSQVGPPVSVANGYGAVADLNGDGILDVVVLGAINGIPTPVGFGLCLGNGDGTFQPAVFYQISTDSVPQRVVIGDFNNDGILDVTVLAEEGVWLFTGKGGGAFNSPVLTPVVRGYGNEMMAGGDLDGTAI